MSAVQTKHTWTHIRPVGRPAFSLREIRDMAEGCLGEQINDADRAHRMAVILLSAYAVGPHATRIAKFTGYPQEDCTWASITMRRHGWWKHGGITTRHTEEDVGDFQLVLDAMHCAGVLWYKLGKYSPGRRRVATTA